MIERWVQALSEQGFAAEEMADAAWLTLLRYRLTGQLEALGDGQARKTGSGEAGGKGDRSDAAGEQDAGGDDGNASVGDGTGNTGAGTTAPERNQEPPAKAALFAQQQQRSEGAAGGRSDSQGTPVKIRQAPALRDPLTFVRALRPLIRPVATGRDAGLDETATAQKIADEGVWLPVMRPQVEPWLDLAVVVDESPSMLIWRRTVWELVRLFKNYGAFRDVRVWGLVSAEQLAKAAKAAEAAAVTEAAEAVEADQAEAEVPQQLFIRPEFGGVVTEKSLRRPEVLIDPNQRRLVLVLSDCVSSFWQSGLVLPALQTWAAAGPMALVQMLPDWMWARTVLRHAEKVDLYGLEPATANQRLTVVRDLFADALEPELQRQNIRVPILTLEADKASVWSQMVGGKGSTPAPGLIFNPTVQTLLAEMEQQRQFKPTKELSPQERVQRFKAASTLVGRRLAGLLAAAPVINLQIVRLIQATLVRESEQVHVAEVLLGGLMSPVKPPSMAINPDVVEYRFKDPEIRTLLLKGAPIDDAATILMQVSAYVNANLNRNTLDEFVAKLQQWLTQEEDGEADEAKPFAVVAAEVLKRRVRLSAEQAALVETVEARYRDEFTDVTTSRTGGYRSFAELSQHEQEGEDYQIREAYRVQGADNFGQSTDEPTSRYVELSSSQRLKLFRTLNALPTEQFDNLVVAVDPPPGILLPYGSPQKTRVSQLLYWSEGPTGPGLAEFIGILQENFDVRLSEGVETIGESKGASPSHFAVVAIHGGTIQPGTTEVAEALAGEVHGFYTFEGLKPEKSDALYIPSHLFDEPRSLRLVSGVTTVVSINGCKGEESFIHLGGLDDERIGSLRSRLTAAGFTVAETEGLRGIDPNNICNRGRSRQGIQLELSAGLRDRLREDSRALDTLVTTLRRALTPAPPPARTVTNTAADPIQKRWAFLVGINQYDDPAYGTLEFCVDDVKALGRLLQDDLGFDVTCLHDDPPEARYKPIRNSIKAELKHVCDAVGPDDLLLVHFACYGIQIDNQPCLVTSEVRSFNPEEEVLPVAQVKKLMQASGARCKVLLLDASPTGVDMGQYTPYIKFMSHEYEEAEGFAIISASTAQQRAYEIGGHGVFTHYLMAALQGQADGYQGIPKKGFVSVQDCRRYVLNEVKRWNQGTGRVQTPTSQIEGVGDMILAYYPEVESQPAEAAVPSDPGFPELRTLEFTKAEIIDAATLINGEALEPFEFVVATLTRQDRPDPHPLPELIEATPLPNSDWIVRRYRHAAQRYLEVLSEADAAAEVPDYAAYLALEMVAIPGGTFTMGSPEDEPGRLSDNRESPQHEVVVPAFFMGRYPVTQAQWRFVAELDQVDRELDPDPARFKGEDLPVERVSWQDAMEFCARLSRDTGREYGLPTEAEWEYACRAHTQTAFHFGETITPALANYRGTESLAEGPTGEYREGTTTVGYFGVANAFGLSDMHGNVWEWCQDHWHSNYEDAPKDGSAWLTDNEAASRVRRGGSWYSDPGYCRSAYRAYNTREYRLDTIGFRVVSVAPRT